MNLRYVLHYVLCSIVAGLAIAQTRAEPPLLTVCEALRNLPKYRGGNVVLVGKYEFTFEGPLIDGRCADSADGVLLEGHRWVAAVALSQKNEANIAFPVDESLLRQKLSTFSDYGKGKSEEASNEQPAQTLLKGNWVAVYGKLESPRRLRPYEAPSAHRERRAGNGYMSNGTVPAMISVIRLVVVDPKR